MSPDPARRLRAVFPDGVWEADVQRRHRPQSRARVAAEAVRREIERSGVAEGELQACDPEGPGGTQLEGCLKIYLPLGLTDPLKRPYGMVFIDVGRTEPALVMIAFGTRHQPKAAHAADVYQRAHRRLHPPRRDNPGPS